MQFEKSELHLHLGGAWPLDYLEMIADPEDFNALNGMLALIQKSQMSYHDAFQAFGLVSKIVNTEDKVENGVVALCQNLINDNVTYAEFRTGLKSYGQGLESYLNHVLKGIEKGTQNTPLKAGLILSIRRDTPSHIAEQTVDFAIAYRNKGVIGIDLSGDSTIGDVRGVIPALIKARKHGLPITLHIGESNLESPFQQMMELNEIQPQRIGHGVHLCEEARHWIKKNNALVELCLSSSIQARMIDQAIDHPALDLLLQGHPVAICTDDPLIFNTSLSREYEFISAVTGLNPEEIHHLQLKTKDHYFLK